MALTGNIAFEYEERLIKAFPSELTGDVKKVIQIVPFNDNEIQLHDGRFHKVGDLIHSDSFSLKFNNESLTIPYRLYFNEPNPELEIGLTNRQKDILNCIYLRHFNGFIREKRLKLISDNADRWVVPYVVKLLGEYLYELLPVIDKKVNEYTLEYYFEYANENQKYWQQTESRMISIWDLHYRSRFPKLKEYIGYKIIKRIKKRTPNKPS